MKTNGNPTTQMRFAWPWRPYQQRVLEAMDVHLADGRLHIVAAPGSGKTILGLEAFRRLGRPGVILSPTVTIRDQWLARLEHFLPPRTPMPPEWSSRDLTAPGFLTSITYQALHTKVRQDAPQDDDDGCDGGNPGDPDAPDAKELAEIIRRLREVGTGTLILDEAHHLRQAWWKALQRLVEALDGVTLIALTATPPYGVSGFQWHRYEELCGPIDEEISAPELVKSGTLCPHQDYVRAVTPGPERLDAVRHHDAAVEQIAAQLAHDDELLRAVEAHPWMHTPTRCVREVLENPELAVALLACLRMRDRPLPRGLLRLLDARASQLPPMSRRWWQVLVEHYLFGHTWRPDRQRETHRDALLHRLRDGGLLYRRELRLSRSAAVEQMLSLAPEKIQACITIHRLERALRGTDLRQVILTDFIRDDDRATPPAQTAGPLGAWPVFRTLAQQLPPAERPGLALLTGRLVVVHRELLAALRAQIDAGGRALDYETLPGAADAFIRILRPRGNRLVEPLTALLASGRVNVLVGTRALLGEGWDAPAVNSLVLASYAGSFVLSNQMRGRAIRSDPRQPDKTATIWHVVAVAPETPSGWADLDGLERRFDAFVGVGATRPVLESGLRRLELPPRGESGWVETVNRQSEKRLKEHERVRGRWESALAAGASERVLPGIQTARPPRIRSFVFFHTLRYLLATAASVFLITFSRVLQTGHRHDGTLPLAFFAGAAGLVFTSPMLVRAAVLAARHLPVDGSLREIALALCEALRETGHLRIGPAETAVRVRETEPGVFAVSLRGATFRESAIYADCLAELLGPIANPRYLLTRPGRGWFRRRRDYHAVPGILAVRKERAAALHKTWRRRLGGGALIYTRTESGRRALLRARARAFSTRFTNPLERFDRWQ